MEATGGQAASLGMIEYERNVRGGLPLAAKCSSLQGYLARKKMPPPLEPHRTLGIGLRLGPRGGAFSYERGTPVQVFLIMLVKCIGSCRRGAQAKHDKLLVHPAATEREFFLNNLLVRIHYHRDD